MPPVAVPLNGSAQYSRGAAVKSPEQVKPFCRHAPGLNSCHQAGSAPIDSPSSTASIPVKSAKSVPGMNEPTSTPASPVFEVQLQVLLMIGFSEKQPG